VTWFDRPPLDAEREVETWVAAHGLPRYRASQIAPRLWTRPIASWDEATDLPRALIELLRREHPVPRATLAIRQQSVDGTIKYLWQLDDATAVEAVLIPERRRRTLCLSSQAGCAFACTFCATGRMGFGRHLSPWEIAAQVRELMLRPDETAPTNVVFMGMGEPLHNWRSVDTALTILNAPSGLGIGARHVTVSTVGLVPGLRRLAARPEQFGVALSLHSPFSDRRAQLMPVERKYPLPTVLDALRAFRRRVTFEYVMIDGFNDRSEDATALATLAPDLHAHVNLLALHPGGDGNLRPSPPERIETFAGWLRARGTNATVRRSRGLDIDAACGQLRIAAELGRVAPQHDGHVEQ